MFILLIQLQTKSQMNIMFDMKTHSKFIRPIMGFIYEMKEN